MRVDVGTFRVAGTSTVAAGALWLLFTGSVQVHELLVGACSITCALIFVSVVLHHEKQTFELRRRDALLIWRTPGALLTGIVEILLVLGRDLAGKRAASVFRVCGFKTAKGEPLLVTRRALATAYTSVAPNFIVIGLDYQQSRMLFHQLKRSAVPRTATDLGAEVGNREESRRPAGMHAVSDEEKS